VLPEIIIENYIMNKLDSKKAFSDKTILLLCILNLLFLSYYLMLAFYSRFHYDDLHFLWKMKEISIGQFVSDFYFSRSGRFVSYFKVGLYSKLILIFNEHRYLLVLCWLFGVALCWSFARYIFRNVSNLLLINIVFVFYNLFVLTNIDFAVFNWLCAMDYYLLGPMLVFVFDLVNRNKLSKIQWILLILVSVLIGGGQESFTPLVLGALFSSGLYYLSLYHFKPKVVFQDIRVIRLVISILIILICFVIVVIAPGNYKRIEMSEFIRPTNISGYILGYKDALSQLFYQLMFYAPYYFVLCLLFVKLGRNTYKRPSLFNLSYKALILYSFIIYGVYILISVFPSVYLWSGFGIQRNYTPVVFFTMIFICFHAFLFGCFNSRYFSNKIVSYSLNFGLFLLSCIMVYNIYTDTISAKTYAKTVDDRLELLQKLNMEGTTGIISVNPIAIPYTTDPKYMLYKLMGRKVNPHPVLYYMSDTELEPNEYSSHYKRFYGLSFEIKLK